MRVVAQLTPEYAAEDALNRASMSEHDLALARMMQILAFTGDSASSQPAKARMDVDPQFRPAPLYVTQAMALRRDPELRRQLLKLLQKSEGH